MRLGVRLSDAPQPLVIFPLTAVYNSPSIAEPFADPSSSSKRFYGSRSEYGYISRQRSEPVVIRVSGYCSLEESGECAILVNYTGDVRNGNIRREDLDQESRSVIIAQKLEQGVDVGQT